MGMSLSEFEELVNATRELAKKSKHLVTPDTLIVYVDKGGRLVRIPFEESLKGEKVKLPAKRYFLNFSVRLSGFNSCPDCNLRKGNKNKLNNEVGKWLKESGVSGKFKNVLIVDENAHSGMTLSVLKGAFQKVTGKKTKTAVITNGLFGFPPDIHTNSSAGATLEFRAPRPVKNKEEESLSYIRKTVPDKRGMKKYAGYSNDIKETMRRMRRR